MGRSPCCDKTKVKKGPWSAQEDALLLNFIARFGNGGNWISLPQKAGLNRCGKSCRLRYLNYLRPDIKHGGFTEEEDYVIYKLFNAIGSRWAIIASNLPGRTDNDVKNYWNTKLKRKISSGEFNIINNPITNSCKKHNNNNNSEIINNENITKTTEKDRSYYAIENLNMVESKENIEEIPSYYSGYSSSNSTDFNGINGEEDEFWMDLLADSFDSSVVAVASHQLQQKMTEIASLLHHT